MINSNASRVDLDELVEHVAIQPGVTSRDVAGALGSTEAAVDETMHELEALGRMVGRSTRSRGRPAQRVRRWFLPVKEMAGLAWEDASLGSLGRYILRVAGGGAWRIIEAGELKSWAVEAHDGVVWVDAAGGRRFDGPEEAALWYWSWAWPCSARSRGFEQLAGALDRLIWFGWKPAENSDGFQLTHHFDAGEVTIQVDPVALRTSWRLERPSTGAATTTCVHANEADLAAWVLGFDAETQEDIRAVQGLVAGGYELVHGFERDQAIQVRQKGNDRGVWTAPNFRDAAKVLRRKGREQVADALEHVALRIAQVGAVGAANAFARAMNAAG